MANRSYNTSMRGLFITSLLFILAEIIYADIVILGTPCTPGSRRGPRRVGMETRMPHTRHKSAAVAMRFARRGTLFTDNAAAQVGL